MTSGGSGRPGQGDDPLWFTELESIAAQDPDAVPREWQCLLANGEVTSTRGAENSLAQASAPATSDSTRDNLRDLVTAWQTRGYLVADYDPLGLAHKPDLPDLTLAWHAIDPASPVPESLIAPGTRARLNGGPPTAGDLVAQLRATWAGTLSADFQHLEEAPVRDWIRARMENPPTLEPEKRRWILDRLTEAESLEAFLQLKYPTSKRYGMEGSEAQLPLTEHLLMRAAGAGIDEIVIGPMHRGRTTFMPTVMGKPLAAVIAEFTGRPPFPDEYTNAGDASFHMGHSGVREIAGRAIKLSMASHPSHVEAVIPVSLGKLRAKLDAAGGAGRDRFLGLMMHTDGGVAGQGIVSETAQLSRLDGFGVGGTIHVTVDNQVAFTTRAEDQRSTRFASDILKLAGAPVFRVNADDPEAAVRAADLAFDFWRAFRRDVVIELVCYRRRGHNEMDEPRYTQPGMYARIEAIPPVRDAYLDCLIADGVTSRERADDFRAGCMAGYAQAFDAAQSWRPNAAETLGGVWQHIRAQEDSEASGNATTGWPLPDLEALAARIYTLPQDFSAHHKVATQFEERHATVQAGANIAWSTAEALAFGSLLADGHPVRLTGQDCRRGTFSQRHGAVFEQSSDVAHYPLAAAATGEARFGLYDSPLSEAAVMAFEYGYSLAAPDTLVCWEAQFGDFANGAQIIIDQFIAPGAEKWFRYSGLVLLLPHGMEGGGPEHSSARLERFLQLCARKNLQIVNCTTPANYFHALRRQLRRDVRQPLVVMTPKSLLRHRRAVSPLSAFGPNKQFEPLLPELRSDPSQVDRLVLCSGRVYYDLLEAREAADLTNVALARVEELYPLPATRLIQEIGRFAGAELVWCQEEPQNMGAWNYIRPQLRGMLRYLGRASTRVAYAGRPANPSPATGYPAHHKAEQTALVQEALAGSGD